MIELPTTGGDLLGRAWRTGASDELTACLLATEAVADRLKFSGDPDDWRRREGALQVLDVLRRRAGR